MHRMAVAWGMILVLGMAGILAHASAARAAGYTYTSPVFRTYDDVSAATGGTVLSLETGQVSDPLDLGFSFPFYGAEYTQVVVKSPMCCRISRSRKGLKRASAGSRARRASPRRSIR